MKIRSSDSPLGVVSICLKRRNEDEQTRNTIRYFYKRLSLKYSRYSASLDDIEAGLKNLQTIHFEGLEWVIQSFYGGTKIKYTREEDVEEDEETQRFATRSIFSNQTGPQQQSPTSQQENSQDAQG